MKPKILKKFVPVFVYTVNFDTKELKMAIKKSPAIVQKYIAVLETIERSKENDTH